MVRVCPSSDKAGEKILASNAEVDNLICRPTAFIRLGGGTL